MSIQFTIRGQVELGEDLRRIRARVLETVGRELTLGLMAVEAKSKPLTPVSPGGGLLRAATYVSPVQISNGEVSASIYNNQDYAEYVHERNDPYLGMEQVKAGFGGVRMRMPVMRSVKWTIPGTGPKFIEKPLRESLPSIQARVSRSVEELAKEGG